MPDIGPAWQSGSDTILGEVVRSSRERTTDDRESVVRAVPRNTEGILDPSIPSTSSGSLVSQPLPSTSKGTSSQLEHSLRVTVRVPREHQIPVTHEDMDLDFGLDPNASSSSEDGMDDDHLENDFLRQDPDPYDDINPSDEDIHPSFRLAPILCCQHI